jgi:hypothetical protein
MELFSNPWVIGVLGSIPGGFLVNWVTGRILGKRENREYLQKVIGANREVVYAIRPGISEGQIPTAEVLASPINATARRYDVEPSDLYTPTQIAEELVKEVMDSSFISSAQKSEYCTRLATLGVAASKEVSETAREPERRSIAEYRQRLISSVGVLLGILTATMTLGYSVLDTVRSKKFETFVGDKNLGLFLPVLAAAATMTITLVLLVLYRDLVRRRRATEDFVEMHITAGKKSSRSQGRSRSVSGSG